MLSYKGYIAEVDYDDNAEVFFGTVVNALLRPILPIAATTVLIPKNHFPERSRCGFPLICTGVLPLKQQLSKNR